MAHPSSVITQMAAAKETTAVFGTYKLQTLKGHNGTLYKHLNTCLEAPQATKDEAGLYLAGERKGNKHTGHILPLLLDGPAVTPAAAVGILSPPGRAASTRASTPALTPLLSHASLRPSFTSPVFYNDSGSPAPLMSSVLLSEFHTNIWAILPSRQVISGRILNGEVAKADESNGWKNVAKQSLITGMVNVEYTPHILNVTDVSAKPKTAEALLDIILKEIDLALGLLKKEQANSGSAVILVLILPVLTHWMSHYLALDRLLALKELLRRLVVTDSLHAALITAAGKTSAAKTKAQQILIIISRDSFWTDIKSLCDLLRPFAIATNAAQADNCHLNTILLLLGYLYHTHSASH
ncbi:hypothetical protein FB446DRAFT_793841 [Lentinula raphanica]|nr:hypothetical protein FB446DRAFT_793841 [Lentinula raphanica]